MADNNDIENLDELNIPSGRGGRKKSKILIWILAFVLIFFVAIFAYFKFLTSDSDLTQVKQESVTKKAKKIDNTATQSDSEVYRDAFKEEDVEKAEKRAKSGKSAIPRLMREGEAKHEAPPEPEPAPPPPPPKPKPKLPDPIGIPAPLPDYSPGKSGTPKLSTFLGGGSYSPGQFVTHNVGSGERGRQEQEKEVKPVVSPSDQIMMPTINITPGTLLYAVIDIGGNSDDGSTPIIATVVSGAHAGTKFIGGFQRRDERLVIQFNRCVVKNKKGVGQVYSVAGFAINPDDYSSGIASSVNTHFIERWGGLIASSFLEGFGEAKRQAGTKYNYGNDNNPGQYVSDYDLADEAWIAAGKVGEKLQDRFEDMFDMPPTVKVSPGTPIGILIL